MPGPRPPRIDPRTGLAGQPGTRGELAGDPNPPLSDGLRWILRRLWPFALVMTVLGSAGSVAFSGDGGRSSYEASALVIARRLDIAVEQLPRFGEAIFNSPEVANLVIERTGIEVRPDDLIPHRVTLEPVGSTVLFEVAAVDQDAVAAADLANATADAFVEELNQPGEGVGQFAVQSRAVTPVEPASDGASPQTNALIGAFAGFVVGLGAMWLLLVLRSPITSPAEAVLAVGARLLGTISLPVGPAVPRSVAPEDMPGLRNVARTLFASSKNSTWAFVAPRGNEMVASQIVASLAALVIRRRDVLLFAGDLGAMSRLERFADEAVPPLLTSSGEPTINSLSLIDATGIVTGDLPDSLRSDTRLVYILAEGAKAGAVRNVVTDNALGPEVEGLIFVRRPRVWRRPSLPSLAPLRPVSEADDVPA